MGKAAGPQSSLGGPPPTPAVSTGESGRQRPPSPSCRAPSLPGHQVGGGGVQSRPLARESPRGLECSRALGPSLGTQGERSPIQTLQALWIRFAKPLSTGEPPCPPNVEAARSTPEVKDRGPALGHPSSAPDAGVRRPLPERLRVSELGFSSQPPTTSPRPGLEFGAVTLSPAYTGCFYLSANSEVLPQKSSGSESRERP